MKINTFLISNFVIEKNIASRKKLVVGQIFLLTINKYIIILIFQCIGNY